MTRLLAATALALSLPFAALAVGGDDSSPPKQTNTTKSCKQGMVWDAQTKKCAAPQSGALDDDTLYGAVREFAYAGQYGNAIRALDAMSDQQDDRVLTYRGFTARKSGDVAAGMAYYRAALEVNPDNLLTRSYMGQALVEMGDFLAARDQLAEIGARGGAGTWAETALRTALETGTGYSH